VTLAKYSPGVISMFSN